MPTATGVETGPGRNFLRRTVGRQGVRLVARVAYCPAQTRLHLFGGLLAIGLHLHAHAFGSQVHCGLVDTGNALQGTFHPPCAQLAQVIS